MESAGRKKAEGVWCAVVPFSGQRVLTAALRASESTGEFDNMAFGFYPDLQIQLFKGLQCATRAEKLSSRAGVGTVFLSRAR